MRYLFERSEKAEQGKFIAKKLFAFFLLYAAANLLQQLFLAAVFAEAGYDPAGGNMPSENIQMTALYYGCAVYIPLVILYCRLVEKRPVQSIGFTKRIFDYGTGTGVALLMLLPALTICCTIGHVTLNGTNESADALSILALLGGFVMQGAAEEVMCRGFLMTSLMKEISVPKAIFWSATAFALLHFSNLLTVDIKYAVVGILNLYLVSVVFSLLMLLRGNIWVSCGLHSIWNFLIYGVFGMTLSGNEADGGILCFIIEKTGLINGGSYGMESGLAVTAVLGFAVLVLWKYRRENAIG